MQCAEKNGVIDIDCRAFYRPRVSRAWVHFDLSLHDKNKFDKNDRIGVGQLVHEQRSCSSTYGGDDSLIDGSFRIDEVKEYVLAEDKKEFRKYSTITEIPEAPKTIERICWESRKLIRFHISESYIYPALICAHCLNISSGPTSGLLRNPLRSRDLRCDQKGYWRPLRWDRWFQLRLCPLCRLKVRSESPKIPVFYSRKNDPKDPRAFLYGAIEKPKKSFFKKYISRHLNRVRKLRPISSKEVSFFRSWLGVKELAALAN